MIMTLRYTFYALSVLAALTLSAACGSGHDGPEAEAQPDATATAVRQIQQCSRLYTTEYRVHKIITCNDRSTIDASGLGFNLELDKPGHRKMVVPIDATLKGYIDFGGFSEANIEREADGRLIITLPDPEVMLTSSRVDHEHLQEFVSPYRDRFSSEEKNELIALGRQAIVDEIPRLGIDRSARTAAVRLLMPLFTTLGFQEQDITIQFRSDFSSDQLIRHLD